MPKYHYLDIQKRYVDAVQLGCTWNLSVSRCEGGLGSVVSDVTGFGGACGLRMLQAK